MELYFDPTDDIYEVENANSNTQDHHCVGLYIFLIVLMVVIIVSFHCSMRNYDALGEKQDTCDEMKEFAARLKHMVDPAEESSSSVLVIS